VLVGWMLLLGYPLRIVDSPQSRAVSGERHWAGRRSVVNVEDVFGNLPTLETERLLLRKLSLDDVRNMFAYGSDPQVTM